MPGEKILFLSFVGIILDLPCSSKEETKKRTGRAWEGNWHLGGVKDVFYCSMESVWTT